MVMRPRWKMGILAGLIAAGFLCGTLDVGSAAEPDTKAKTPKAKSEATPKAKKEAKPPQAKTDGKSAKPGSKPKYKTAETAGKGMSCFGEAPKIDKVSPDEGKAGDKVTITGTKFGSKDCLRSVSFGPGHAADFTMKNETTISATVPGGGRKGLALLTVTTASGEDSKPFSMK